jgi:hypothetical protein
MSTSTDSADLLAIAVKLISDELGAHALPPPLWLAQGCDPPVDHHHTGAEERAEDRGGSDPRDDIAPDHHYAAEVLAVIVPCQPVG